MFVCHFVLVKRIDFHLFLGRDVVVYAVDGTGGTDVVPQAIGNDGPAGDPRSQVQAIKIAERANRLSYRWGNDFRNPVISG